MSKEKKRALFVASDKYAEAQEALKKVDIESWSDTQVMKFDLFTFVVTTIAFIVVTIAIAVMN